MFCAQEFFFKNYKFFIFGSRQLRKQVESLKHLNKQLEELEQDKNVTEQEATRLKRQVSLFFFV